jgi:hypothetical protein
MYRDIEKTDTEIQSERKTNLPIEKLARKMQRERQTERDKVKEKQIYLEKKNC